MPYLLEFVKRIDVEDTDIYFNECCHGGDVVCAELLPAVPAQSEVQHNQEDWGWFVWFRQGSLRLAIDVFCDDPTTGSFRIHLTSRERGFFRDRVIDTPELEALLKAVQERLSEWLGASAVVTRLDRDYGMLD